MADRLYSSDRNSISLYSKLFKEYFDTLFNYGIRVTNDKDLVKDSIQELFFKIWKNKIDLSRVNNPKSYLLKSLRHQLINIIELKPNKITKTDIEESFSIEFSPEDYYITSQQEEITRNRVLKALNKLTEKQKEAIYLRFFEDLEYEEISEIMKINIQSVKNNVQRAYEPLRQYLSRFSLFFFSFF